MLWLGRTGRHRAQRVSPSGFTLVELLVVIAIIGVLVGLLVYAVGGAQVAVRKGVIATEVAGMNQGLKAFKTTHGTDFPPDFSNPLTNQQVIDQFTSRMFRYRDAKTDVPRTAAGLQPALLQSLDPAEALWFWLRGFTSDPQHPLFGPLGVDPALIERTPIYDFDKTRLLDLDGDSFLEYYPRFATERPYVYYAHYTYQANFAKPAATLLCRLGPISTAQLPAPRPYLTTQAANPPNPMIKTHFAAADSFQIISAGLDNDYGLQVLNTQPTEFVPYAFPTGPYPEKAHRDNITSFTERTLEDAVP